MTVTESAGEVKNHREAFRDQLHNSHSLPANHPDSPEFESGFDYGRDGFPLVVAPGWRFGLLALGPLLGTLGRRLRRHAP